MTPTAVVTSLEALDIDAAVQGDLERAGRLVQQLRGFLNGVDAKIARRATALHASGHSIPPEDLLARTNKSSRRDAERSQRRAETLGKTPTVEQQLAKGRISNEHADAITNAANRLDDAQRAMFLGADQELAQAAAAMTPEKFRRFANRRADQLLADEGVERSERQRGRAYLSMGIVEETGMGYIRGELHPEDYQRVRRALDGEIAAVRKLPECDGLRTDQIAALALVNVVTGARSVAKRNRAEVSVHIDVQTLLRGTHHDTLCEYADGSPLPVETARRHACEAEIIPIVLGGNGLPLDVGRSRRLATPEQRLALRSMYRTCAIDGCDRRFDDCEIHHLLEWLEGGPTDLVNLLPVCPHHHHRAHEGRWRLELDPTTRELVVWLPNGTELSRCLPDLVAERIDGASAGFAA
jgi:hypothetical protein